MIEMGKKYQTRDGRAVRILATDMRSSHPIAGIVTDVEGTEFVCSWTPEGYVEWGTTKANTDLIPVPTKHEGWGIIIKSGSESVDIAGQINVWLTSSREDTEYKIRQQPEKNWHLAHVTWED